MDGVTVFFEIAWFIFAVWAAVNLLQLVGCL